MTDSSDSIALKVIKENTLLNERYLIVEKIATGGMGNIYKALDLNYDHLPIAIKVLHQGFFYDKQYVARFKREVELASQVSHPNVVKIFDLIETQTQLYYTMEFISGSSLEELLGQKEYSEKQFARLIIETCDGLEAIHQKKIIHRDIKPGNIMLQPDGSHKIIDFGIGRGAKSNLTKKNVRVGSIFYISPESWQGKPSSFLSDYYSLGCMLYQLWNSQLPYESDSFVELMKLHCYQPIPEFSRTAPIWVRRVVEKLMAKEPAERFQSNQEIVDFIHTYYPDSQVIQRFSSSGMGGGTIRKGESMMSVFKPLSHSGKQNQVAANSIDERKTIVFSLRSTMTDNLDNTFNKIQQKRRGKTIVFNLPRNAALVFEFRMPTREFLYLGIFLGSLNLFDWYLTGQGMNTFGVHAEGNNFMQSLMHKYGADKTLFYTKGSALVVVLFLTVLARKSKAVQDLVGFLSIVYLLAAIIPWIYILYYR